MKTLKSNFNKLTLIVIAFLGLTFTACDTNDDDTIVIIVSEERAAEIVATSLAYNTYGIASNVNYVSTQIANNLNCEEQASNSGTLHYSSIFGNVTSIYQFDENYAKSCIPVEQISYNITALQNTDAVYFTSQEDVEASFIVTGLEDTTTHEVYSGSYRRDGNWFSKVYQDSLNTVYSMSFTGLNVDKSTSYITSGTSTFTLSAAYSESDTVNSFNGTVTFLNEDEAQIDFTNGNSYLLNLETGEIHLI